MDLLNTQKKVNRVNNFARLTTEDLNRKTAKQLLNLIEISWSDAFHNAMGLKSANPTWEDIGKIRIQIAKTIWKNFPKVAKRKGLRKFN